MSRRGSTKAHVEGAPCVRSARDVRGLSKVPGVRWGAPASTFFQPLIRSGVAALGIVGVVGCGPITGRLASAPAQTRAIYAGRSTVLFDDSLDPTAVGIDFDKGHVPKSDPILRERAQVSDAVARVKVATVTGTQEGPDATYRIGLRTVEKLAGPDVPASEFTVAIGRASASHGILKTFEGRLVGIPLILFVREFVRPGFEPEVHFHLAPDTKEVKDAVGDAVVLGQAGASQGTPAAPSRP